MARTRRNVAAKAKSSSKKGKQVPKKHAGKGVQKKEPRNKKAAAKAITEKVKGAMQKPKSNVSQTPNVVKRKELEAKSHITRSRKSFEKPVQIGDEDFISHLPIVCLDEILTMLNHADLDVLAAVSQTMLAATCYSRCRAAKIPAYNLSITQVATQIVEAVVVLKLKRLRGIGPQFLVYGLILDCTPAKLKQKFLKKREHFSHPGRFIPLPTLILSNIFPIDRKIMENLVPRLKRFSFASCTFDSMVINDAFVRGFEGIGTTVSEEIKFENCAFTKNLSIETKSRFLSLLISSKPSRLRLVFTRREDVKVFDEDFIRSYAESVEDPQLCIHGNERLSLTPKRDSLPALSRFSDLTTVSIIVEPEYLLDMIVERLDVEPHGGSWVLPVTGEFTDAMLARNDIEQYSQLSTIVISKMGQPHCRAKIAFFTRQGRIDADVRFERDVMDR